MDVFLVLLVAWLVACGLILRQGRGHADEGLTAIRAAERRLSADDLLEARALAPLEAARDAFRLARQRFSSPIVAPLGFLPVAGRQLRSARALAVAAAEAAAVAADAVTEARDVLGRPRDSGSERVAFLASLGRIATRTDRALAAIDLGPGKALVGPLARARADLGNRLSDVRDDLRDAGQVATGLAKLLGGGGRYLLLAANNAEMRAGSGMFLGAAELNFADGQVSLGAYRPTGEMVLDAGRAPVVGDGDLAERWGWLHPEQEWRNLALSPRFPASAQLAARMWRAGGGQPVTGVIALDPLALQALLAATGPVRVGDATVTDENVVAMLLHDQYAGLSADSDAGNAARQEQLGVIASAVVAAINAGSSDLPRLADGLAAAARGRHLLAWSADAAQQRMWAVAGVDGTLGDDSLLVSVLNRGGNKLDQFLQVAARLGTATSGSPANGELVVTLRNGTPEGESQYVAGPHPGLNVGSGDYVGMVSINLPGFARDVTVDGDPELAALGPDGPTTVVAWPVRVDRGASATFTVRFGLPAGAVPVWVEPSARVPAVRWTAPGASFDGGEPRLVTLTPAPEGQR